MVSFENCRFPELGTVSKSFRQEPKDMISPMKESRLICALVLNFGKNSKNVYSFIWSSHITNEKKNN